MNDRRQRDSNELLNVLLIILGILYVLRGFINVLGWFGIIAPEWLGAAAVSFFGGSGLLTAVMGVWCILAGIFMFGEKEWAFGVAIVILSLMIVEGLAIILTWIGVGTVDLTNWVNWITIIAFLIGVFGFFWLIFTSGRYH
ncbi:MAG: hypothetical protein ACQERB_06280 [Promethearchaeati archaeon]|nr:MAG: hypothetical protein EU518_01940 [Candidatus Lokiarchaeota archaeon]